MTRDAAAAGDTNRLGIEPTSRDTSVQPDTRSSATRSPLPVATTHTAPPTTIGAPGVDSGAFHPTSKVSPCTVTCTTPSVHGTNMVPPTCATPPYAPPE